MIDIVSVQTYSCHSVVSLKKTLPLLGGLGKTVLNFSHISIKFQADSNNFATLETGQGNCLPYVLEPSSLFCESGRLILEIKKL